MTNGFITWSCTVSLSLIIGLVLVVVKDIKYRQSLKGYTLDKIKLRFETLESELEIAIQIEEYREAIITISIIILSYVRNMRPQQLMEII